MGFYEESIRKEGYTKALLDVKNWLSKHPMALKYNKLYNEKGLNALMEAFIENADTFIESGEDTQFILTNSKQKIVLDKQEL